jgi:hypothetical protein
MPKGDGQRGQQNDNRHALTLDSKCEAARVEIKLIKPPANG